MVCRKCGSALSNDQIICPFCGVMKSKEQLDSSSKIQRDNSKDLKVNLLSEKYGMEAIRYEKKVNSLNDKLIVFLVLCGIFLIFFLVMVIIFL